MIRDKLLERVLVSLQVKEITTLMGQAIQRDCGVPWARTCAASIHEASQSRARPNPAVAIRLTG